ncbi:MAG: DUF1772 domain-containing protein [Myxococcales bacterium]|nr:DUF1772 domain-containing protein [Myxococcales bacterium]
MAGVYFAFSTFVMRALALLPAREGAAAMRVINEVILSSLFMPLFYGTSLLAAGLSVAALLRWGQPGAPTLALAGVVYLVGMLACTAVYNVPWNDALATTDVRTDEGASVWADYLVRWTRYNHVRTVASAMACAGYVAAALQVAK